MGLQMSKTFPQILCFQVSIPHYLLALFSSFICTETENKVSAFYLPCPSATYLQHGGFRQRK